MSTEQKTQPHCNKCDSTDVRIDAFAEWDVDKNAWVLADTYDAGFCRNCESDLKFFNWKPITP